ncbi:MAG TPA: TorD/DmsD family molecular chaperone [Candidatus Tripitaka sp. YC43]
MNHTSLKYLLGRSALYGLLARCFHPLENGGWQTIVNLSKEVPKEWKSHVQGLLEKGPPSTDDYMRSFGTAGACHDCETAFLNGLPTGGALADVAGFYQAFSFPLASKKQDPPDHIATELEFLSFMFAKEAKALFAGDKEARKTCLSARGKFVRDHMSTWMPPFADGVAERIQNDFYIRAAALLVEALKEEDAK